MTPDSIKGRPTQHIGHRQLSPPTHHPMTEITLGRETEALVPHHDAETRSDRAERLIKVPTRAHMLHEPDEAPGSDIRRFSAQPEPVRASDKLIGHRGAQKPSKHICTKAFHGEICSRMEPANELGVTRRITTMIPTGSGKSKHRRDDIKSDQERPCSSKSCRPGSNKKSGIQSKAQHVGGTYCPNTPPYAHP